MNCDNCYFAGLFHCAHPKRYIESFIQEDCELWKEGEQRAIIDETVICGECGNKVHLSDAEVFAKGSKIICNECLAKSF